MKDFFNFFENDVFLIGWALENFVNKSGSALDCQDFSQLNSPFEDVAFSPDSISSSNREINSYVSAYGNIIDAKTSILNMEDITLYFESLDKKEKIMFDVTYEKNGRLSPLNQYLSLVKYFRGIIEDTKENVFLVVKKDKSKDISTSLICDYWKFEMLNNIIEQISNENNKFDIVKLDELIQKNIQE